MTTTPGRAVYDQRATLWWNATILTVMALGGAGFFVREVASGGPPALVFAIAWFAVVGFVARGLVLRTTYRLEVDAERVYWRRRGAERSASLRELRGVSATSNVATFRFDDEDEKLQVHIGGGFENLVRYLEEHSPGTTIDLGWFSRVNGRVFFLGGGFTASGRS